MAYTSADLSQAERHVAHGRRMVQFQQAIVDEPGRDDLAQRAAESWLAIFQAGLAKHIVERDKITEQLATRYP